MLYAQLQKHTFMAPNFRTVWVLRGCFVTLTLKAINVNKHRSLRHMVYWPNMAVKGTRRPQALLKVCSLFGFVGFVLILQPARPLLLR